MRKIKILLAIAGGILVLGLVTVWVLVNPNRHRDKILAQLEQRLGRKVMLGNMSLGLLPPRFQVENPIISEDPAIGAQLPFVQADKLDVRVGLFPLLRGDIQIDSLNLVRPKVELVRTPKGTWNFSTLGPADTAPAPEAAATKPAESPREFALNRLTVTDGQIGVTDLQNKGQRAVYDHIDFTLTGFAPGKPFNFDLAAHVQGAGAQEIRLKGEGGPVPPGKAADTPFRGTLSLNEVGIDGLMKFLNTTAITKARGVLSGEGRITSQAGVINTDGMLNLTDAQVNALDIGYPIQLEYKLTSRLAEKLVTIDNATLHLGKTPLSVTGSMNTGVTPMEADLRIRSGDVSVAEIARVASAFGVAFAPGTSVTGRVQTDVHATGPLAKPRLEGTIAGRDLAISGPNVPQPVNVKAVNITLTPTAIQSDEFTATSGQTTVVARFALAQYTSDSPSADVSLRAPGATLPEIQSIARAYGIKGLDQINGKGSLNFDLRAKGPVQSLSTTSAVKALNGVINLDFSPLQVTGFDTAHELAKLAGLASSSNPQTITEIVKITGRVLVKDGIAQSDDLKAQLVIANLAAAGIADLSTETLDMKVSAVFSKAFSDKVGSNRVTGLLNTVLANQAGEIVLPAIVTGTFKQPRFAPDLKALAQLQKQRILPTLTNPEGPLSSVLGILKGKPNDTTTQGQPAPTQEKKPSPLKGLLDALGGRK